MGNFVCTQCNLEYMGPVDIPPVELKCTICGNQNFSFELDEDHYDNIGANKMKLNKIITAFLKKRGEKILRLLKRRLRPSL